MKTLIITTILGALMINEPINPPQESIKKTRLDSLMNKIWKEPNISNFPGGMIGEDYDTIQYVFKKDKLIGKTKQRREYTYYLTNDISDMGYNWIPSNEEPQYDWEKHAKVCRKNFRRDKVGKNTTGKYIVTQYKCCENIYTYNIMKIAKLTENRLHLKHVEFTGELVPNVRFLFLEAEAIND